MKNLFVLILIILPLASASADSVFRFERPRDLGASEIQLSSTPQGGALLNYRSEEKGDDKKEVPTQLEVTPEAWSVIAESLPWIKQGDVPPSDSNCAQGAIWKVRVRGQKRVWCSSAARIKELEQLHGSVLVLLSDPKRR